MEKFEGNVKFVKQSEFMSFYGYNNWVNVYKFETEDGKTLVWKTGSVLQVEGKEIGGLTPSDEVLPTINSIIHIKAAVKGESEYKGEKQTMLSRVKVLEIVDKALTKEEENALKAEDQIETLKEGDFVWYGMPYRQYKNNYADCETLAGSYDSKDCTIDVIIRDGRLKNSGTRGQHYSGYRFVNENGKCVTYRAVSIDNAEKRVNKEFPNHTWTFDRMYDYHIDPIW
jgi:hypothetical protein